MPGSGSRTKHGVVVKSGLKPTRRAVWLLVLSAILTVSACADSKSKARLRTTTSADTPATSATTSSVASTTSLGPTTTIKGATTTSGPATTVPATTTTRPPATTTTVAKSVSPDGCVRVGTPHGAIITSAVSGDVDGDGRNDLVQSYYLAPNGNSHLLVVFGGAGGFDSVIGPKATGTAYTKLLGAAALGNARPQVIFVKFGPGTSTGTIKLFAYAHCSLQVVTVPNGSEAVFTIGGTFNRVDGLSCDPVSGALGIGRRSATRSTTSPSQYTTNIDLFRYSNGKLSSAGSVAGTIDLSVSPKRLGAFAGFSCGALKL